MSFEIQVRQSVEAMALAQGVMFTPQEVHRRMLEQGAITDDITVREVAVAMMNLKADGTADSLSEALDRDIDAGIEDMHDQGWDPYSYLDI
jgi:hypothetical protein